MTKRVLVVDDSKIVCKGIKRILEDEGYSVDVAYSGEEGAGMLKKKDCRMAIIDLVLPGMDGVELCRLVKEKLTDAKIVLMSGYISKLKERKEEFDAIGGCKEVIEKPFESEKIISLANDFFEHGHGC